MPRPPAVSSDLVLDADVCARAGSTIERRLSVEQLPRLAEAGALDGSRIDVRLRFSLFDQRPAVDGTLRGTLMLSCQRCMQPVAVPIDEQFQVILVQQESADEPGGYELLASPLVPLHAVGECDQAAAPPPDIEQRASAGAQRPFENLRDLLEK
jgi:uncharacterized protein